MSRGIGRAQVLVLRAIASLEAEYGKSSFYVWAIAERCYALSPALRERTRRQAEAAAARYEQIREMARNGNADAKLLIHLDQGLSMRWPSPRRRRANEIRIVESSINPSRALAALARRGLLVHRSIKGGGSARLTQSGRAEATRALCLSVGTSLRLEPKPDPSPPNRAIRNYWRSASAVAD